MKRRYLLPLLYIVADALSMMFLNIAPVIPVFLATLSVPCGFVMGVVSRTFGVPTDPAYFAYFVGMGTILQMFLLGVVWELLVDKIRKLGDRKPALT